MLNKKTVKNISDVKITPMTRGQVRSMRRAKLDPAQLTGDVTVEAVEKTEDWILENVYPEYDFDDLPNNDVSELIQETYLKTFGKEKEVKN